MNLDTRNPSLRPSELPVKVLKDGETSQMTLPVKDHPYFLGSRLITSS